MKSKIIFPFLCDSAKESIITSSIIGLTIPSPPGSVILPGVGSESPIPLSVIVITILSTSPSPFASISVAPSSQVSKFWSSLNTIIFPLASFFKYVVAANGFGRFITTRVCKPFDKSLSKSVNDLFASGTIENWNKSELKAKLLEIESGFGKMPMSFNLAFKSNRYFPPLVSVPFRPKSPIKIDPTLLESGLTPPLPNAQFLPALNSAALVIGKLLIFACFLSGTPSPSKSVFFVIVSKTVGIPSSSGLSAILITTLYGPFLIPNKSST